MLVEQQQRVIADRLEMAVVGAALLLAVDRAFGRIHVENDPLGVVLRLGLRNQLAVHSHQPQQVIFARQHLCLEALQSRGQCPAAIPVLLRADRAKGRIGRHSDGVIEVLVAGESAVNRLPQQIGQRELLVRALPRIHKVFVDQLAKPQSLKGTFLLGLDSSKAWLDSVTTFGI